MLKVLNRALDHLEEWIIATLIAAATALIGPRPPTTVALPVAPGPSTIKPKVYDSSASGSASRISHVAVPEPLEIVTRAIPTAVPPASAVPACATSA